MSGLTQAVRSFKNIWGQADDDYGHDEHEDNDAPDTAPAARSSYSSSGYNNYSAPAAPAPTPTYGGGSGSGSLHSSRRLRAVPSPLRSREKNIYTIKPKSQDDAAIAADYLKTGDAVIVNLEEVDRVNAVRIIDFMSGVCYGLEGQGHAMKLGDAIFLYTPPEFEIRSDEVDYGENEDFFFKDVQPTVTTTTHQVAASSLASAMTAAQGSPIPPQGSPIPQQGSPIPPQTTPSGYTNPAVGSAQTTPYQGVGLPPRDRRPWES